MEDETGRGISTAGVEYLTYYSSSSTVSVEDMEDETGRGISTVDVEYLTYYNSSSTV